MTKINLLPPEKVKKKGAVPGGKMIWLSAIIPILVLAIIGIWWFSLGSKVSEKQKSIDAVKDELKDWQAKNKVLEKYEVRLQEIKAKEEVIVRAVSGRVYWARVLDNIARNCPSDVWFNSVNCTTSFEDGTVEFQGYAKQCRNRWSKYIKNYVGYEYLLSVADPINYPADTVTWPPRPDLVLEENNTRALEDLSNEFHAAGTMDGDYVYYPDYRPIARWIESMEQVPEFARVWVSSAEPEWRAYGDVGVFAVLDTNPPYGDVWEAEEGDYLMLFSSKATLDMNDAQIGPKLSGASAAPSAPQPQTEGSTSDEGGTTE